jgi:transcriptional regulator with XRE-family HTH domain
VPEDIAAVERRIEEALRASSPLVFGERIKASRTSQGISIRELATRAKLSKTSIVSLEKGETCRPVTIMKVCAALGLHLERFADQETRNGNAAVHRRNDDRWYDLMGFSSGTIGGYDRPLTEDEKAHYHQGGVTNQMLMFRSRFPDSSFWPGILEFSQPSEARQHPGEEFIYVLKGMARIQIGEDAFLLEVGESLCFDATVSHSYAPHGCSIVSMVCIRINTMGT